LGWPRAERCATRTAGAHDLSSGNERGQENAGERIRAGRDLRILPRAVVLALGVQCYSFCWFVKGGHSIWFQPTCILKHFWDVRNVSLGGTVSQTPYVPGASNA